MASTAALYCCAPRDIHGSVPSMHLDGMKQEEVEKSNLLGTVVAVCPAFVPKVCPETRGNHISHYGFSDLFKKPCTVDYINVCYEFY